MSKKNKIRLDDFLLNEGYFDTKSQAQGNILAGKVKINDKVITKAGFQIRSDFDESVKVTSMPYVSRGGFKLEKALCAFNPDIKDKICLDAGASTGGFTDCLLQNGAKQIYAVDVGYGQLAWKLRSDERVVVIERTNIRTCEEKNVYSEDTNQEQYAELAVMDLSFISLTKVLANIKKLMNPRHHEMLSLIKPQFEAGKEEVDKGSGVIRDKDVHVKVIKNVLDFACTLNLYPLNLTYSPIKGPAGNIEYLVHLSNDETDFKEETIYEVVDKAYEQLTKD